MREADMGAAAKALIQPAFSLYVPPLGGGQ